MSIRINIYIEGREGQIGLRRWSLVPSIGEKMVVKINEELVPLTVKEIMWGVTEASREHEDAEVSIELEVPAKTGEQA
jgi:hypothetical protein